MSEYRKKTADRCLDKARSISINANRVIVVWLFVLVSVWFFKIEPHYFYEVRGVIETINEKQKVEHNLEKLNDFSKQGFKLVQSQDYKDQIQHIEDTLSDKKQQAKSIVFPVPGLGELPIPTNYAPVFWTILMFGLLIYIFQARRSNFLNVACAIRIYSDELQVSSQDLVGYAEGMAWWMKPIPTVDGVKCTSTQFQNSLGKDKSSVVATVGLSVFIIFIFIAELRMGYLLWSTTEVIEKAQLERVFLLGVQFALIVATILFIYMWSKDITVPDFMVGEIKPIVVTRREFLFGTGVLTVSFLILPVIRMTKTKILIVSRKNPRFMVSKVKRVQNTSFLPFSFYRNIKSGVIHYIFAKGELKTAGKINESNFEKINDTNLLDENLISSINVDLARSSVSYETAALQLLESGETEKACDLLFKGIDYQLKAGVSSYRLADLLAGVATRNSNEYLKILVKKIVQSEASKDYSQRIKKWLDTNSKWHRRWSDKSSSIKWAGLLM